MIKDSPNPPGQPDYDTSTLHEVAYRAIAHYLNPGKPIPEPSEGIFTVRADLGTETLLVNASQDLASISDIANHLAFEIDGSQRNVALGICRMLEGVQLLVDKALNVAHPAA
ncbi:hypothetical protein GIW41_12315 [Pseudomonas sp. PA-6-1D]|jgi:hypothetical protein|uniref:DUF3077 domain-containing protein n=2 Tax=Pseudomonas TaxID=286 RepID=A0A1H3RR60_9PSED|nr:MULTISPECIES: DUF6124 family protein [Pseudomonas]MCF5143181.1 hypothetical protein [Pseudomonas sp. PA-6-3C]MCF5162294.1 hypothetical protein [Pseudomonas sp. PA-6-2E]MCF5176040.1 hypothetical protein [Pseudomonas sp. PA-6-1D]MCF5194459.1 hypothetical protein [Pseudomonas sp. PA-6-1H]MCF5194460.1 hypothetical protein [Pseudomonas sp. PA-6-1H]